MSLILEVLRDGGWANFFYGSLLADETFCKAINDLLAQEDEAMKRPRWYQWHTSRF